MGAPDLEPPCKPRLASAHCLIGECLRRTGRLDEAVLELQTALRIAVEAEDRQLWPELLDELAAIAIRRKDVSSAGRLLGAAERLREAMDIPVWDPADLDQTVGMLRSAIGGNSWENEAEIGRTAPDGEILALAASIH